MGAGVDSQMTRYLSLPVVPRVMGFDARLQFLHPTDAVGALLAVTREDHAGTYNVGAPDIVSLSQALRLMGRPHHRGADAVRPGDRRRCCARPGWGTGPPTRSPHSRTVEPWTPPGSWRPPGSRPRFTSRAALEEFVGVSSPGLLRPERVDQVLAGVTGLLDAAGQRPGTRDG